jgi:hypothetical protein
VPHSGSLKSLPIRLSSPATVMRRVQRWTLSLRSPIESTERAGNDPNIWTQPGCIAGSSQTRYLMQDWANSRRSSPPSFSPMTAGIGSEMTAAQTRQKVADLISHSLAVEILLKSPMIFLFAGKVCKRSGMWQLSHGNDSPGGHKTQHSTDFVPRIDRCMFGKPRPMTLMHVLAS